MTIKIWKRWKRILGPTSLFFLALLFPGCVTHQSDGIVRIVNWENKLPYSLKKSMSSIYISVRGLKSSRTRIALETSLKSSFRKSGYQITETAEKSRGIILVNLVFRGFYDSSNEEKLEKSYYGQMQNLGVQFSELSEIDNLASFYPDEYHSSKDLNRFALVADITYNIKMANKWRQYYGRIILTTPRLTNKNETFDGKLFTSLANLTVPR